MTQDEYAGLVAVVTGGASGIGSATARLLAEQGAVVACLDLAAGDTGEFFRVQCDVGDDDSVRAAIAAVVERFGRIDIVVNNAGIGAQGTIEDNDDAEWLSVLNVNVLGVARVTRAALPHLRRSAHAAVVNVCSIASWTGLPERALYSASKGAVQALTLAMAADHVADGVRINCVNPGTVATPWIDRLMQAAEDPAAERLSLEARQPIGRLVTAQEVARAIVYLAAPWTGSTTGTVLAVDGGMHGLRLKAKTISIAMAPVDQLASHCRDGTSSATGG